MTPDEIRRSWDDDDTPRSVFPEPLAERLTRENKELRAEVERLRAQVQLMCPHLALSGSGEDLWRCDECGLVGTQDEIEEAR